MFYPLKSFEAIENLVRLSVNFQQVNKKYVVCNIDLLNCCIGLTKEDSFSIAIPNLNPILIIKRLTKLVSSSESSLENSLRSIQCV